MPPPEASSLPIRADLADCRARAWERLTQPGTWWSGEARVAIAAEARAARRCALCFERKEALSPVSGRHDGLGALPENVVEVVHRIATDPGRLSRQWYESVTTQALTDAGYVEIVGVVAQMTAVDTFGRGLGYDERPLPEPQAGEPSRRRPVGAGDRGAWVATIGHSDHGPEEADIFADGPISNIRAALTLVPDEARGFQSFIDSHYVPRPTPDDFFERERALSRPQIELLAARVSALNQCFY